MKQVLLNEHGFFIGLVESPISHTDNGIPLPPELSNLYYYEDGEWKHLEDPVADFLQIDPIKKCWVDNRDLEQIKNHRWSEIKSERDQLEFSGFEFEGGVYDSDQVSQGRIMGAAAAGIDQVWTLADNTTVQLTAQQLKGLYAALQAHVASAHEKGRNARQLIFDAETREHVEAIQL